MESASTPSEIGFFARHEFLLRRLHSLSGLVPVGLYMVVHLIVNASILNGIESFQNIVYQIHSLGHALLVVEWGFIFLPLLFHALLGFVFIFHSKNNTRNYPYRTNYRYYLQRVTGMIAFVFILWHILHMHGLFHGDWYRTAIADAIGIARFRPYNAASTAAEALQSPVMTLVYAIGVLACVYHFANGLWTMGITWGVWVTPKAQAWASHVCMGIGALVALIGLLAIVGFWQIDPESARVREYQIYEQRAHDGSIFADQHKQAERLNSDRSGTNH